MDEKQIYRKITKASVLWSRLDAFLVRRAFIHSRVQPPEDYAFMSSAS